MKAKLDKRVLFHEKMQNQVLEKYLENDLKQKRSMSGYTSPVRL